MRNTFVAMSLGLLAASCGGSKSPDPIEPVPIAAEAESAETSPAPPVEAEALPETGAPAPDDASASAGPDLVAAERLAFDQAKPVFDTYCAKCHSKDGKKAKPKTLGHFDMTTYPFGGHHAGEAAAEVRKVLGIGGGKATMPLDKPGAVQGDELARVAAWADAFDKTHAAGQGNHGAHKH